MDGALVLQYPELYLYNIYIFTVFGSDLYTNGNNDIVADLLSSLRI